VNLKIRVAAVGDEVDVLLERLETKKAGGAFEGESGLRQNWNKIVHVSRVTA